MKNKRQMSDSYLLGTILALIGGYLDAYTYIARGGVFANAQTGNIVLLGINLAKGNFTKALFYLLPVITFAVGVVISEGIRNKFNQTHSFHWRQIVAVIEAAVLFAVAFMRSDMTANILVSFVCSLQVETFRKVNGHTLATTMCTGNLRTGTETLFYAIKTGNKELVEKSLTYYIIIITFIIGAIVGTVLTIKLEQRSVLFAAASLVICFAVMFADTEKK